MDDPPNAVASSPGTGRTCRSRRRGHPRPHRHLPSRNTAAIVMVALVAVLCFLPPAAPSHRIAGATSPTPLAGTGVADGAAPSAAHPGSEPAGNWVNVTASVGTPPPLLAPGGMAYDVRDGYAVAFGGTSDAPAGTPVAETWTLAGGHWQNLTPSLTVSPPPRREGAVFVYDPALDGVVLFGGLGARGYLGDTWLFSGGRWADLSASQTTAPSARDAAIAAFDPVSSSLVLFGGVAAAGPQTDTYALTNGLWTKLSPSAASPPTGCCGAMTYDAADGYLLAALSPGGSAAVQTWSFAAGTWTNRSSAVAPSPRLGMAMAFDGAIDAVYLFGGNSPQATGPLNDSWTYSARGWTESISSVSRAAPSPRWSAGFSATGNNSSADCLVLLGGFEAPAGTAGARPETWELCGNSTSLAAGPGGGSGSLSIGMTTSRSLGVVPFEVTVVTRASGGGGPYNLSVCPGTGRCEQALAWDGSSYTSTQLFSAPGTFTLTSVVTDQQGTRRAATATVEALAVVPLVVPYTFSPVNGTAPLPVTFQVSVRGGYAPYTIEWNFGDGTNGSSLSGVPVDHVYASSGSYTPTLTVADVAGESVNRTLPTVHVAGGSGSTAPLLGATALPAAAVGLVALGAAAGAIGQRRRRNRLEEESRELVEGLWSGRAGPPPGDP